MKTVTGTLLVSALLVAATAIGATTAAAAEKGTDRPFTMNGSGTNIVGSIPDGECVFMLTARGPTYQCDQQIELDVIGTHIGRGSYSGVGAVMVYLGESCITPSGGPGFRFESNVTVSIIAANGDVLNADTSVSGCSDGITGSEPVGTYTFTGGTGRFADASGTGTIPAVAVGTSLTNTWAGTISY